MIVALLVNLVANGGYSYRVRSAATKATGLSGGTDDENVAIVMILGRAGEISEPRRV
jgi:hypothetical protein